MPFLAAVLRLADILDFDRDRTPEALIKSIHFTSSVSLAEWEKHRAVEGWQISSDIIRFSMKCKSPAYEAAARKYMDWIDVELSGCVDICRRQPRDICGHSLNLPTHVDRSRIGALNEAYCFHDLEFSLTRDQVVRLLMTDKLYGRPHLCIRELLQNSLDALRYRKALFSESGSTWEHGKVVLRHYVNEDGNEVVECADNGCGMDEEIIRKHFTKVGRSFYRSPFFERERSRLKISGSDFDPCSQFGIGFMSCFMLGDRITVRTRRDFGYGRAWGPPLVVEIHGLSGLLVVRKGVKNQPVGTTVSIVSRKRPSLLDIWSDQVQLCTVLKGYALATEFTITGHCEIPEIEEEVSIPKVMDRLPTTLEAEKVVSCITIEQDLSVISQYLAGFIRESFLTDTEGVPCLANTEAEWLGKRDGSRKRWCLCAPQTGIELEDQRDSIGIVTVCIDGILVAGNPGRARYRRDTRMRLGSRNSEIYSVSPALIDVRGPLKPEITPQRTPPAHLGFDRPPGWQRLSEKFGEGIGRMWEHVAEYMKSGLSAETFHKLALIHDVSPCLIPHGGLWETFSVMLLKKNKVPIWRLVRELGELSIEAEGDGGFCLADRNGYRIGPDQSLSEWEARGCERPYLGWHMNATTLLMSALDIRNAVVRLYPCPPAHPGDSLSQYAVSSRVGTSRFLIPYVGAAHDAITLETPYPTANRNHPLVELFHQSRHTSKPTTAQIFARAFVPCISDIVSSRPRTPTFGKPGYWGKRAGHLYFGVPWHEYDSSLRPPYRLWTRDRDFFGFDEADFIRWRDASI